MKILIASNLYPPIARGGAEQVASRVAHELYCRGHGISVLTTTPCEDLSCLRVRVGERHIGRVYRFFPPNFYHLVNGGNFPMPIRLLWHMVDAWSPAPARALERVIREESPDAVLTHNLKGLGMQLFPAIRRHGIRHVHVLHDLQLSVPSGLLMYGEEQSFANRTCPRTCYERVMRGIVGSPDVVISPSRYLAETYRSRGFFPDSDLRVLPNPTPPNRSLQPRRFREGPLRILFAGQLEHHKGLPFLFEALAEAEGLDYELHVAGEGSMELAVRSRASMDKRVIYHGFVSLENLQKLFSLMDVVVLPSLCYENSPTVIYESFQSGVPVIANDIGGISELVRDGENGYLTRPGDKRQFLDRLQDIVEHRREWFDRQGGIRDSVASYALGGYVEKLEGLLRKA